MRWFQRNGLSEFERNVHGQKRLPSIAAVAMLFSYSSSYLATTEGSENSSVTLGSTDLFSSAVRAGFVRTLPTPVTVR